MEQTPDKRAHLVTTLFDSLADSPELLDDVKDSMVATVLKNLRNNAKDLKRENALRKQENEHTWNSADKTFESVIDRVIANTTDIEHLKRKVDQLYESAARAMLLPTSTHTHALSLSLRVAACCAVGGKKSIDHNDIEREDSVASSASSASSANKSMRNGD